MIILKNVDISLYKPLYKLCVDIPLTIKAWDNICSFYFQTQLDNFISNSLFSLSL